MNLEEFKYKVEIEAESLEREIKKNKEEMNLNSDEAHTERKLFEAGVNEQVLLKSSPLFQPIHKFFYIYDSFIRKREDIFGIYGEYIKKLGEYLEELLDEHDKVLKERDSLKVELEKAKGKFLAPEEREEYLKKAIKKYRDALKAEKSLKHTFHSEVSLLKKYGNSKYIPIEEEAYLEIVRKENEKEKEVPKEDEKK